MKPIIERVSVILNVLVDFYIIHDDPILSEEVDSESDNGKSSIKTDILILFGIVYLLKQDEYWKYIKILKKDSMGNKDISISLKVGWD